MKIDTALASHFRRSTEHRMLPQNLPRVLLSVMSCAAIADLSKMSADCVEKL